MSLSSRDMRSGDVDVSLSSPGTLPSDLDATQSVPDTSPDMLSGDIYTNLSSPGMPLGADVEARVSVPGVPSIGGKAPTESSFGKLLTILASKITFQVSQPKLPAMCFGQ